MKKNNIIALCLFQSCIFYFHANAQPALTAANTNPRVGENFMGQRIAFEDAGTSGANVTWDFSTVTPTTPLSFSFVSPSSTPFGSSFSNADVAYELSGSYDYYSTTSGAYTRVGAYVQAVAITYTNSQDQLRYPFTYDSSYTDNFSATFTSQGVFFQRAGTITVEADGYGTLILPEGTVNDVLRVKSVENYTDTYTSQGVPGTINYYSEIYTWYKPGKHYPLLALTHLDSDISFAEYGFYLNPNTVGVVEAEAKNFTMSVFPNPAASQATISFSLKEREPVQLTVLNSIGQVVVTVENSTLSPGNYCINLNVHSFASGIYFVKMTGRELVLNQRLLIQH